MSNLGFEIKNAMHRESNGPHGIIAQTPLPTTDKIQDTHKNINRADWKNGVCDKKKSAQIKINLIINA